MSKDNGKDENYWKRLYKSLSEQYTRLEETSKKQGDAITALVNNLTHAQSAVDLNKRMLRDVTTDYNRKEQDYIELINRLKNKLRELGYADFNRLGE